MIKQNLKLGIYEKAFSSWLTWEEKLLLAKKLDFQFIEMSIDESDDKLSRLDWNLDQCLALYNLSKKSSIDIPSICLSGHRRFPLGSLDPQIRKLANKIMEKAIFFARCIGARTIQLAGYDVYYENSDSQTKAFFLEGLQKGIDLAARENIMLAMEIMDTKFLSSIVRYKNLKRHFCSPWFSLYPDVGNLAAWGNDVIQELELGFDNIAAIHLKDTLKVSKTFPGKFKDVPFGRGCVDFISVFKTLARLQYKGPFLVEMWEKDEREISKSREWLIEQMCAGGYING